MTMFRMKQRRWWIAALTVGLIVFAVGAALQAQAHGQDVPVTPVATLVEQVPVASSAPVASVAPTPVASVAPTTPVASTAPAPAAQGDQTLAAAIDAYMATNTEVRAFTIQDEQIVGDTARVLVVPPPDATDPALVFARKGPDGWTVLSIGTWFPQDFYQSENIPTELWIQ